MEDNIIKIVACAPPRCNCPEMLVNPTTGIVIINDDYGSSITMTYDEFKILAERFNEYATGPFRI